MAQDKKSDGNEKYFPGHPDFVKTVSKYSRELGADIIGSMVNLRNTTLLRTGSNGFADNMILQIAYQMTSILMARVVSDASENKNLGDIHEKISEKVAYAMRDIMAEFGNGRAMSFVVDDHLLGEEEEDGNKSVSS